MNQWKFLFFENYSKHSININKIKNEITKNIIIYEEVFHDNGFIKDLNEYSQFVIYFKNLKIAYLNSNLLSNKSKAISIRAKILEEAFMKLSPNLTDVEVSSNWGIESLNLSNEQNSLDGDNIKVAILDSGIDLEHQDFSGRVIPTSVVSDTAQDFVGHGTHIAGIACGGINNNKRYGVATKAKIYACKVTDSSINISQFNVLQGFYWAMKEECNVICLAFSQENKRHEIYNTVFERVIRKCKNKNILCISGVGNDSDRESGIKISAGSPASCPTSLSVTGISEKMKISNFSNRAKRNQKIDFAAPAEIIFSSWSITGDPQKQFKNDSGTSMATAFVTGIVALLYQKYPNFNAYQIEAELKKLCKPLDTDSRDCSYGFVQSPV
ncbi:S8 family peptidase [Polaribacter aquimarinus]|uniref:Peptidase S8/S53 domain-containing protein n=1 Tax=Polaribacter aquimarinus TaxID=2100726 RepID=A0A2U2J7I9_9FLAO|nr:S8 family serine peptidase [Polaribacter aquimarinus]PWG04305.1 hypothetical protein DIS07_12915 [Polaribacter aquimarinus]